jgi:Choline kinase N terminus
MSAKSRFGSEGFDCQEQKLIVPSCEAVLDVCSVHTPVAHAQNGLLNSTVSTSESKQQRTEAVFKREVLQITQTLKLGGWNKIPLSCSDDIGIKKLSGTFGAGDQQSQP